MNYYQPTYTLVTQKPLVEFLTQRLGPYQMALTQMLELETISDGNYMEDVHEVTHGMEKDDVKNAMAHALKILDMLDVMNGTEAASFRSVIAEWFGATVFHKKIEYVMDRGQWYSRDWQAYTLPKAKNKMGTIYSRDFHIGQGETAGLSIAHNDGKTSKMLVHGGKMESHTKLIVSEQQKFIRNMSKHKDDASTAEKIRQRYLKIASRLKTVRTEHINNLVAEILEYTRLVILCGATTPNDLTHYQKIGMPEVIAHLELVAIMVRRDPKPIEIIHADTRMMRPYYDENPKNGHAVVAKQIASLNYSLLMHH